MQRLMLMEMNFEEESWNAKKISVCVERTRNNCVYVTTCTF